LTESNVDESEISSDDVIGIVFGPELWNSVVHGYGSNSF